MSKLKTLKNTCIYELLPGRDVPKRYAFAIEQQGRAPSLERAFVKSGKTKEKRQNLNDMDILWTLRAGNRFPGVKK